MVARGEMCWVWELSGNGLAAAAAAAGALYSSMNVDLMCFEILGGRWFMVL